MEISADHVGLLPSSNLESCIAVLLKTTNHSIKSKETITTNGLHTYLEQKNESDHYLHQKLIVCIKMLCSFHLRSNWLKKSILN